MADIFVNGSGRNEQSLQRTSHRCILPSFGSFGKAVSEKIFQKSTNWKQEWSVVAMFVNGSGRNEQSLERTFHKCFLPSFGSFGQSVSEEKNLKNQPIRNKNYLWWPGLLTDWDGMSNLYRGPSIDASYQVSVHLAKWFQRRRIFRNQPIRNKNCLQWPCLLTDQNEMSNLNRCFLSSFGSFGQVVSEETIFLNRPIKNKNCLWQPCLLMDRDKMSNLYRGPSLDASYQVSHHLAEGIQRRRLKCEKLTDDGRQVMAKAHIAFGKVS